MFLCLLAAVSVLGCGSDNPEVSSQTASSSAALTTPTTSEGDGSGEYTLSERAAVPARSGLNAACAKLRREAQRRPKEATFRPICPKLEPAGARTVGDWFGASPYNGLKAGYGYNFYGGVQTDATHGGHWTFAMLKRKNLEGVGQALRPGTTVRRLRIQGLPAELTQVASYEDGGGYYGGHTVVTWKNANSGCQVTLHGWGRKQRDAAIAIMATVIRVCTRARK